MRRRRASLGKAKRGTLGDATIDSSNPSWAAAEQPDEQNRIPSGRIIAEETGDVHSVYAIGDSIGDGAFGSVRLATDLESGRQRAIKILPKGGRYCISMIRRELDLLRRMDHPNVITFIDIFEDARSAYFAMELAGGGELYDRIVAQGRFSEDHTAITVRQILQAVAYMHGANVAHRDIKPENIVFSARGCVEAERNLLKIIDFGVACPAGEAEVMTSRVGSRNYMAPEVARGRYDRRCDVWSVGVVMYVLLTGGELPIGGRTDDERLQRLKEGRWAFNGDVWEEISPGAKRLIQSLMRLQAAGRPTAETAVNHPWLEPIQDSLEADICDACGRPKANTAWSSSTATPGSSASSTIAGWSPP